MVTGARLFTGLDAPPLRAAGAAAARRAADSSAAPRPRPTGPRNCHDVTAYPAMDLLAVLVKDTRDRTFVERSADGKTAMATTAIFSLGGATMDNEWNHIQQKLMRGLGVVAIENQARI